jgi:outer membrane biosynthesis protein TonB
MPSELNRRAVFAALAAFVLALAVAYALSSTGEASEVSGTPGTPAQPLDVASGIAGQTTLGAAEALPALVRKPKPPAKKPESVNTSEPAAPSTPAPSTPTVTPPPPVVNSPPVNSPPSTPSEPPVQFEDSG